MIESCLDGAIPSGFDDRLLDLEADDLVDFAQELPTALSESMSWLPVFPSSPAIMAWVDTTSSRPSRRRLSTSARGNSVGLVRTLRDVVMGRFRQFSTTYHMTVGISNDNLNKKGTSWCAPAQADSPAPSVCLRHQLSSGFGSPPGNAMQDSVGSGEVWERQVLESFGSVGSPRLHQILSRAIDFASLFCRLLKPRNRTLGISQPSLNDVPGCQPLANLDSRPKLTAPAEQLRRS